MSELSPEQQQQVIDALSQANDEAYETSLLNLAYELEHGAVENFFIDETYQSDSEAQEDVTTRINALCEILGIPAREWAKHFIEGEFRSVSERSIEARSARNAERQGITIGRFVTELAWDALPFEHDEDGDGLVVVSLGCGDGEHIVHLRSEGSFWTEYPPEDSDEDSDIGWHITYEADVVKRGL